MKRHSQNGIALVTTLIMLSLVTFTAVVFLAVTSRERAAVAVTASSTDAKHMAEAALARAQAEAVARLLLDPLDNQNRNNRFNYDLQVSTNQVDLNYWPNDFGNPDNLTNLQFDARVPVFIDTTFNGVNNDFRFYYDFNRNGRFETNGWQDELDNSLNVIGNRPFVGDPEWIGVLERPEYPHGPDNKFIGRYAYLIMPSGKSLDANFLYNQSKRMGIGLDGFRRNQGFGNWEMNLAGFLADLNTNAWDSSGNPYVYDIRGGFSSSGAAFDDALDLLRYRYNSNYNISLSSITNLYPVNAAGQIDRAAEEFEEDSIDGYGDGPLMTGYRLLSALDGDLPDRRWSGSPNTNRNALSYYDIQELFAPERSYSSDFGTNRLKNRMNNNGHYDRYTLYRLLAQMGVESEPPLNNKIHLNYDNRQQNGQTNFVDWDAAEFFQLVADRLLQKKYGVPLSNLQVYDPNNSDVRYRQEAHQALQVAANIYDATVGYRYHTWSSISNYVAGDPVIRAGLAYEALNPTTGVDPTYNPADWRYLPWLPSVFRPNFVKDASGNVFITGYVEETNSTFLNNQWYPLATLPVGTHTNVNVFGIPCVIGARKGFPNFNDFSLETVIQVTRKIELTKPATNSPPTRTNQMFVVALTNYFGIEGWNSYLRDFPDELEVRILNTYSAALKDRNQTTIWPANGFPQVVNYTMPFAPFVLTTWPGNLISQTNSHLPLLSGKNDFLINHQYFVNSSPAFRPATGGGTYELNAGFPNPDWILNVTNHVRYAVIHRATDRVVDFVNLTDLTNTVDLTQELMKPSQNTIVRDLWNTNRVNGVTNNATPTLGVMDQLDYSLGQKVSSAALWTSYTLNPTTEQQKQSAISNFRRFVYNQQPYVNSTNMQAPFTPTALLYHLTKWQPNDPLVHYTREDLLPAGPRDAEVILPPTRRYSDFSQADIGKRLAEKRVTRYSPWGGKREPGGNPLQPGVDPLEYDLSLKDPMVRWSDDWDFPINKFGNIGWLGRVHRGTPWQTIYLKSHAASDESPTFAWSRWTGSSLTHPTNDWTLVDLFTTAPNQDAARGLLSVNQTNIAAWSAALSGVLVLSNSSVPNVSITNLTDRTVEPNSWQLHQIVEAINEYRASLVNQQPLQAFTNVGQILAVPHLTYGRADNGATVVHSPYLNLGVGGNVFPNDGFISDEEKYGLNDVAYERIPQQILSLLTVEDYPRLVVYAFGQSLKPAERSIVVSAANRGLCTNYQITGESVMRSVVRLEGINPPLGFASSDVNALTLPPNSINVPGVKFALRHSMRNTGAILGTPVRFNTTGVLPSPLMTGGTYYVADFGVNWFAVTDVPPPWPTPPAVLPLDTAGSSGTHSVSTIPRAYVESFNLLPPTDY